MWKVLGGGKVHVFSAQKVQNFRQVFPYAGLRTEILNFSNAFGNPDANELVRGHAIRGNYVRLTRPPDANSLFEKEFARSVTAVFRPEGRLRWESAALSRGVQQHSPGSTPVQPILPEDALWA
jgi:hypothetical protein